MLKRIRTRSLEIGFEESGRPDAPAVVLLHSFPYDVHAYNDVATRSSEATTGAAGRGVVRLSRLRRRRHPLLPALVWPRAAQSSPCSEP